MNLNEKLAVLEIILTAPIWPHAYELTPEGIRLYDAILKDAKQYAINMVEGNNEEIISTLTKWSKLIDPIFENMHVIDNKPTQKILAVYKHYADSFINWKELILS